MAAGRAFLLQEFFLPASIFSQFQFCIFHSALLKMVKYYSSGVDSYAYILKWIMLYQYVLNRLECGNCSTDNNELLM